MCFVSKAAEKEEDDKLSVNALATKESLQVWKGCPNLVIVWIVRWTSKGLMPVKPEVHLRGQLALESGKACKLSK